MLYVLDWCVACTGLVVVCTRLVCCMYWTGVLHVLDWCVVCTGLVCCMYWTDVIYVLDWCVFVVCTGRVCCRYDVPTGLQCGTVVTDPETSDYGWVCVTSS